MEKDEIALLTRFNEQIGLIGLPKKTIAKTVGYSAHTLTNISKHRNMPGVMLLRIISITYPDFDLEYVMSGTK